MNVNAWGPLNTWEEPSGEAAACLPWIGLGWVAGCMEQQYTLGWICCETEAISDFTPEPTYPPGMGRRKIIREDEEIMTIIVAFLTMKGQ